MMVFLRGSKGKVEAEKEPWSEHKIAAAMARQTFKRSSIVMVPNCNWTGHECDLLVVTKDLRIIDVEVKISRSDLKADAKKDKWWLREHVGFEPILDRRGVNSGGSRMVFEHHARPHPPKVWKHYYALPKEIWNEGLLDCLPSPDSGVIALYFGRTGQLYADVVRRAKPAKDAYRLNHQQAVDVARLANLRLWDAYAQRDSAVRDAKNLRDELDRREAE